MGQMNRLSRYGVRMKRYLLNKVFSLVSSVIFSLFLVTQKKGKLDFLLFDPDSEWKSAWDILNLVFILYQTIVVPFRLCFGTESSGSVEGFETFMDGFFIVDFFTQFNTAFYSKGILVTNRKIIALNYLSSWFILDLVASFPYSIFVSNQNDS